MTYLPDSEEWDMNIDLSQIIFYVRTNRLRSDT